MKLITILIILLVAASCGSRSDGNVDVSPQAKEFGEFLALFPDVGQALGNEEGILFPLNFAAFDSLIKELPDSIPSRFKKYIHMEDSAFQFYGNTLAQFGEGRPYYPIYKIKTDSFSLVVVYYTVPEVPRQRVMGEHYLLFTYTPDGMFIDAYALAFFGTYSSHDGDPYSRYTRFYHLDNIKVVTERLKEPYSSVEFANELRITRKGKIEETPEQLHFNTYIGTWVLAEQNGVVKALKECDQWVESLNFLTSEKGEPMMEHFTGQMTTVYKVEDFSTEQDDDKKYFTIFDPLGDKRGAVSFYYDDPENITIRIKGHDLFREDEAEILFVKKISVDNGSIEVKVRPCPEEP